MISSPLLPDASGSAPHGLAGIAGLQVRLLQVADSMALKTLRDEVLAAMPQSDCYVREADEDAFFQAHRHPRGETIGVFDGDALVAYAMLGLPDGDDPTSLGGLLGLDAAERSATAHLSSCMVLAGWRGRGLQRALLGARVGLAQAQGRHLCMAVVSLHNHSSRHNMLRRGLHVAWVGDVNGLRRQVAMIDLQRGMHFDAGDERLLGTSDFEGQRAAIADGYRGVGEQRTESGVLLRFVRLLNHAEPR